MPVHLRPEKALVEVLQQRSGTDDGGVAVGPAAFERFTVDGAGEVDHHAVLVAYRTLDGLPRGPLAAHGVDGAVDVLVLYLDLRLFQALALDVGAGDLGEDVEGRDVFQILAPLQRGGLDSGPARRGQPLLTERVAVAALNELPGGFLDDLTAVARLHQPQGHLAGAETGQFEVSREASQTGRDLPLELVRRH